MDIQKNWYNWVTTRENNKIYFSCREREQAIKLIKEKKWSNKIREYKQDQTEFNYNKG